MSDPVVAAHRQVDVPLDCPDGRPGCEVFHTRRACAFDGEPWPCETERLATLQGRLDTVHQIAALERQLRDAQDRSERWIRSGLEYIEAAQALVRKQGAEIKALRFALANGGLEAMVKCPGCGAERTNGETHADDCPIMAERQRDYRGEQQR